MVVYQWYTQCNAADCSAIYIYPVQRYVLDVNDPRIDFQRKTCHCLNWEIPEDQCPLIWPFGTDRQDGFVDVRRNLSFVVISYLSKPQEIGVQNKEAQLLWFEEAFKTLGAILIL